MPGMEFEYDEHGGTSYYFVLSVLAFVLFPTTYYMWPRADTKETVLKKGDCHCSGCEKKKTKLASKGPWKSVKAILKMVLILMGWCLFAYVAYKASQVEMDVVEFDPFHELQLDAGATDREIKKAYRQLSLIYHPDKETGDEQRFMRISKAYQALTNEEAKKNYELYGNPDGPGATHFGIALPKWIVEKKNSIWILALYALVFMIILPLAVGSWWYNSIKYSAEHILMDTERIFHAFPQKTPNMNNLRVIMVLAAAFEFWKRMNKEMQERPSDDVEVPKLMKKLTNIGEKNKEHPLCFPYSLKARVLIHAHLARLPLTDESMLQTDTDYIVKKCPFLLNEMIKATQNLRMFALTGRMHWNHVPRVESVDNMMKVSQMIVQGCWDKNIFLQLPHIKEEDSRFFAVKKRRIRSLKDLARMKDSDRRLVLRGLTDPQYTDVINILAHMPLVTMEIEVKVVDDEEVHVITAGSLVTVNVHLTRKPLGSLFDETSLPNGLAFMHDMGLSSAQVQPEEIGPSDQVKESGDEEEEVGEEGGDGDKEGQAAPVEEVQVNHGQRQLKPWEVNKKKKMKSGKKNNKHAQKSQAQSKSSTTSSSVKSPTANHSSDTKKQESHSANSTPKAHKVIEKQDKPKNTPENDSEGSSGEDDEEDGSQPASEEEVDWAELQKDIRKETMLDAKSVETHVVHCPRYPSTKYEWWWVYIYDTDSKRMKRFVTAPQQVCSLKNQETVELKFEAPPKKGHYSYTVVLRSDSYIADFDQTQKFEIQVSEAKEVESHPQWDFTDEEDQEEEDSDSDDYSDESDD